MIAVWRYMTLTFYLEVFSYCSYEQMRFVDSYAFNKNIFSLFRTYPTLCRVHAVQQEDCIFTWLSDVLHVSGAIRRNVTLQHFTEDDEYLRTVTRSGQQLHRTLISSPAVDNI